MWMLTILEDDCVKGTVRNSSELTGHQGNSSSTAKRLTWGVGQGDQAERGDNDLVRGGGKVSVPIIDGRAGENRMRLGLSEQCRISGL